MDRISAVVITRNEARNVERCLRSIAPVADEVLVVDSGSTDGTVALCEGLGARVVSHEWLGFGPQKNLAHGLASHDWILSIDADEALDPALQAAIAAEKARGLSGAYAVSRLNWYYGRWLRHGFEYPDRKVRLFPRSRAIWDDAMVHEFLRLDPGLAVTRLDGHLLHRAYERLEDHVEKQGRYTRLAAQDALRRGRRASPAKIVLGPPATFLRAYLLKRGFLDGLHGFVLAAVHAHGTLLKYAHLWDLRRAAARAER